MNGYYMWVECILKGSRGEIEKEGISYMRSGKRGFTLIELLVVISIIALLLAILMPALARIRKQAQQAVCMSNLKQWGSIFLMYTNDNNGSFHPGYDVYPPPPATPNILQRGYWVCWLYSYYKGNPELLLCPSAKRPGPSPIWGHDGGIYYSWNWAWAVDGVDRTFHGSYGDNTWVANPGAPNPYIGDGANNWRTILNKNPANIPVLYDSMWLDGWPRDVDLAPAYSGEYITGIGVDNMKLLCINRHNKMINMLFMDFHVRSVGLKELWKFKWHRTFDTNKGPKEGLAYPAGWPDWMRSYKRY